MRARRAALRSYLWALCCAAACTELDANDGNQESDARVASEAGVVTDAARAGTGGRGPVGGSTGGSGGRDAQPDAATGGDGGRIDAGAGMDASVDGGQPGADGGGSNDAAVDSGGGADTGPDPRCGDGHVDPDETCDDSGESATCDDDCSARSCGDGKTNATAGESCDDGKDGDDADGCTDTCAWSCTSDSDCASQGRACGSHVCTPRTFRTPSPLVTADLVIDLNLALDGLGNTIVVWNSGDDIMHAWHTPAGGWSAASVLIPGGKHPRVASDGRGNLLLAYAITDATTADLEHVRMRRYRPAAGATVPDPAGWRPDDTLRSYANYAALGNDWIWPAIGMAGNGDAWLAWRVQVQSGGAAGSSTWVARCDNGGDDCDSVSAIDDNSRKINHPAVAVDNQGGYPIVVWSLLVNSGQDAVIRAGRYEDSWSVTTIAGATSPQAANATRLCADGTGQAFVSLVDISGATFASSVLNNRRPTLLGDFAWDAPLSSPCSSSYLIVGCSTNGHLLGICTSLDAGGSTASVGAAARAPGGPAWTAVSPLDSFPLSQVANDPLLIVDGMGHGVALWETSNGAQRAIAASRLVNGSAPAWSGPADVSARTVNTLTRIQAGLQADGRGMAAWVEDNGNQQTLWVSAFE